MNSGRHESSRKEKFVIENMTHAFFTDYCDTDWQNVRLYRIFGCGADAMPIVLYVDLS